MLRCTRRAALAALLTAFAVSEGCTPTNEEGLTGSSKVVPHQEGTPDFKSYSEVMQHKAQQQKELNAAKSGAKGAAKKK